MTLNCTTVDPSGAPIPDILISASVMETGQIFQRSSDGNGYSNVALEGVPPSGKTVLLSVLKEGYKVWTQTFPITTTDQAVRITLTPFV